MTDTSQDHDGTSARSGISSGIRRLLRAALIAYLVVIVLLTFIQRKLLYRPARAAALAVKEAPEVMRAFPGSHDVELATASGTAIRGWMIRRQVSEATVRRPLVVFFHGNAGHRGGRMGWYDLLANAGADVLAMDYPGYGDSDGAMTESGLEETCDAAWQYALQEGWQPSEIVIIGSSLGGAAAVYLASQQCRDQNPPAGLAVIATFSSMVDVACSHYPWLPVRAVLVDTYPSATRIRDVTCPLVVMHGDEDRVVLQEFGRKLFDAAPPESSNGEAARWLNLSGAGHNNILGTGGRLIAEEIERLVRSAAE